MRASCGGARIPRQPAPRPNESDAIQPPVTLWETIWDDRAATAPYAKIFQTCMLYARELGGGRELMLALEQQPEGGDTTHEIMIGIPLEMAEFRA